MLKFGVVKTSLVDYPGLVAAALFTRGCNLRCPYCHNPELVFGPLPSDMRSASEVLAFLHSRRNVLEGVCVSGGEPLLHPELPDFIREVRALGYKIKIDTNGTLPDVLERLAADYIAMDIKTLPEKYAALLCKDAAEANAAAVNAVPDGNTPEMQKITAASGDTPEARKIAAAVRQSIQYIINSGIDHEFRSTAAPGIFLEEDIPELARLVRGARRYIIAGMRPDITLDPAYGKTRAPYPEETLLRMRQTFRGEGAACSVRGLPE
jgi:pyruvate formate lyase activating enzyme